MKLSEVVKNTPLIKCNKLLNFVNFEDEVYELYITDEFGKDLFNVLEYPTAYIHDLGVYVVGITHYGISWDDIEVSNFDESGEKLCELGTLMLHNQEAVNKLITENPTAIKYYTELLKVPLEEFDSRKLDYLIDEIKRLRA